MGLCLSHGKSNNIYGERTKLCHTRSLATPVSLTNLLSTAKKEQIGLGKAINSPTKSDRRIRKSKMAAFLPPMNYLKTMVSKNRNRHKENGFDLDLTYITDRIIAMAYPADGMQSVFRNHLNDVHNFLELKHKDHYYIYNLCSEKSYDKAKFYNRVKVYPFEDHNPPSFVIIKSFCEDVHNWLESDPENVIAIHCKAGKGRTGTMICCYLLHSGMYDNADDALQFYGKMRTQDGQGVTIPSQIRYVRYYEQYLRKNLTYKKTPVFIKKVHLLPAPKFSEPVLFTLKQRTWVEKNPKTTKTGSKETRGDQKRNSEPKDGESSKSEDSYEGKYHETNFGCKGANMSFRPNDPEVILDCPLIKTVHGDIRIELFYRSPVFTKKKRFARIWVNTFFANINGTPAPPGSFFKDLVFKKHELDIVWKKDKKHRQLTEDFELRLHFKVPTTKEEIEAAQEEIRKKEEARRALEAQDEESSGAEDDSEDENDWESVLEKRLSDPQGVGYRILSECEISSQLITNGEYQSG
ncbi:hypothetical protein HHI36_015521 [Cryptolaemus montrouzieri]|uniref:Phosphatidylinositol 3,4,5-trisphosphate 3-phosphatase and dual-specificity protein phosphatase PTEN n=1 Tax=Cryptolaemus montrouzieri TaxID=559131 RepID=A0ABD2N5W9_9CUCU